MQVKQDIVRFERVRQRTQEVMQKAKTLFGVDVSSASIQFNLRGRTAGTAGCRYCAMTGKKNLSLRFNCEIIQGDQFEEFLKDTIPHEVAHLCGFMDPTLGRKHDGAWRRTCIALGGSGARTHSYETAPARGRGFTYVATCGTQITVSQVIHGKIQAGQGRMIKKTKGKVNRFCVWAPQGMPLPALPPTRLITEFVVPVPKSVTPVAPKVVTGELTWAEKVRRLIRAHKALGVSQDTVICLAIQDLGMTRERARSCVKAHWDKV